MSHEYNKSTISNTSTTMFNIKLFGDLSIEKDGQTSPIIRRQKGSALLAYLILQNRPQSREHIIDLLWERGSTRKAQAALRTTVKRVRQLVPMIESSRTHLSFIPYSNTLIDLHQLESHLESRDVAQINHALELYKGPLLNNLYVEDAPVFNEWLQIVRAQWRRRVWFAYEEVCQSYLAQSLWLDGLSTAQRWLALDPLDEAPLTFVLQFLGHTGQGERAWQLYELSRRQLWDELQLEPQPETYQLAQAMRQMQQREGTNRVVSVENTASPDRLKGLPSNSIIPYQRNSEFVGREHVLLEIAQAFESVTGTFTAIIVGMGGIGKTQLAVEFCYRYGHRFLGGCYWLSFANEQTIEDELVRIGGERGMRLYRDAEKLSHMDKVGRVCQAWQEETPRLLIFDNCESAELLAKWLPVTGGCRILVTSRRGRWPTHLNHILHPLTTLQPIESITLLQKLVPLLAPQTAKKIAIELEHLPLALYLAGRFLRRYQRLKPDQYLAQLSDGDLFQHPSLQAHGLTESPTGHELRITRTFALILEKLSPEDEVDAMALLLLACVVNFAYGIPIPQSTLIDCVAGESADYREILLATDGLNRLIDLGILHAEGAETVQIHRLLAVYAQKKFSQRATEAQTIVAQYLIRLLDEQYDNTRFLGHLLIDTAHLQTITAAMAIQNNDFGTRLAFLWAWHLRDIGDRAVARTVLETAIQQKRTRRSEPDLLLALMLNTLGTITWELGSLDDAWPYYEEALAIRRHIVGENHTLTAQSLQNLAILYARTGRIEEAGAHYLQALEVYNSIEPSDLKQIGNTLYNLALTYYKAGDLNQSVTYLLQSLDTLRAILPENTPYITQSLSTLGHVYYMQGAYTQGVPPAEKAWVIRQKIFGKRHPSTLITQARLGLLYGRVDNHDIALSHLEAAQLWMNESATATPRQIGFVHGCLGQYYYLTQKFEQAEHCLSYAAELFDSINLYNRERPLILAYLIRTYTALKKLTKARETVRRLDPLQGERPHILPFDYAYRFWAEGELAEADGDRISAKALYEKAAVVFRDNGLELHSDFIQLMRYRNDTEAF